MCGFPPTPKPEILLGPVAPVSGSCSAVDWTGAATADSGTITANGDGTYPTSATTVTDTGCYSYTDTLVGDEETTATSVKAGTTDETVLVKAPPATPSIVTQLQDNGGAASTGSTGDKISDFVTVSDSNGYKGPVTWQLLGPVAAVNGSCSAVDWTGAATADSGTITVDGDGTYPSSSTTVKDAGCYSYTDTLVGDDATTATTVSVGTTDETVLIAQTQTPPATPTIVTHLQVDGKASDKASSGDKVADSVIVSGSDGYKGPVTWTLFGPVAAVNGSCSAVDWTGAATADSGTITANGDGTYPTTDTTVTAAGCYSYTDTLVGDDATTATTVSVGTTDETVLVSGPAVTPPPTTPTPTLTPTPAPTSTTVATSKPTPTSTPGSGLADTGSNIVGLSVMGFLLLALGLCALVITRRNRGRANR